MGLHEFFNDTKNILFGNYAIDGTDDFKTEIENALKEGLITKAEATQLMQTRNNIKSEAKKLEEEQLTTISLEDATKTTVKDLKKKKEELRLKKEKEERQKRISSDNANRNNTRIKKEEKQRRISSDNVNKSNGRLKVDRAKLQRELLKDEEQNRSNRNLGERDGKN